MNLNLPRAHGDARDCVKTRLFENIGVFTQSGQPLGAPQI
jgi:hypothetical protein